MAEDFPVVIIFMVGGIVENEEVYMGGNIKALLAKVGQRSVYRHRCCQDFKLPV